MNKIYAIAWIGFTTLELFAQTITGSQINPVAGESHTVIQSNWISPGSSGAGQTWNLSAMNNNSTQTVTNSVSTVAGANIRQVWSTGVTMDLNVDNTKFEVVRQEAQGVGIPFSNPWIYYGFPMSLNTTGTDDFAASFTAQGTTFQRTGSSTWLVDGSGTLITPSGTFTDVLRIKLTSNYTDETAVIDLEYDFEAYFWVKAGYTQPLAQVEETTSTLGGGTAGFYLNPSPSGVSIETNEVSFNIFPNPAVNVLNIMSSQSHAFQTLEIMDLNGRTIGQTSENNIDVSQLETGVYFILFFDPEGILLSRQKFVKS
jgi:hypothetical protein